jgi:Na+/H+ antiporter NhaD/arsenite permease-like protein
MPLSVIILLIVLVLIIIRKALPFSCHLWQLMTLGAIAVLVSAQIKPAQAFSSIDWDIIFYLFGVFVIAAALEQSGLLELITDKLFSRVTTGFGALFLIIFILGLASALLLNDTIAIIGTPIILQLCRNHKRLIFPLLLALAYSISIMSVLSPVGNPQNLLIALKANMEQPFVTFFDGLTIPSLINALIIFAAMSFIYRKDLSLTLDKLTLVTINDKRLAMLTKAATLLLIGLLLVKIVLPYTHLNFNLSFAAISLISAAPILIGAKSRVTVLKDIDWGTLIFFISMFILIESVWLSGFIQTLIKQSHLKLANIPTLMMISTIASQVISNVPLVALYLPILSHFDVSHSVYLALSASSTVAGNMLLIGAASNIIIVHNAERRNFHDFSALKFSLIGIPLTLIHLLIYYVFLAL